MVDPNRVIPLTLRPDFVKLMEAVHKQHGVILDFNEPVLALDPGETTGVAEYDGDVTIRVYQKETKDIGQSFDWLHTLLDISEIQDFQPLPRFGPFKHLRYEDYRVYEWKAQDHAWSPVHTIRWIGAIQVASHVTRVPSSCVMASAAKGWWTDAKLDMFGLNPKGLKHGRDALRHLLYYLLFGTKVQ